MAKFTYEDCKRLKKFIIVLRLKQNRIIEEEKFLSMYSTLTKIGNILVEEHKEHITSKEALEKIRSTLNIDSML